MKEERKAAALAAAAKKKGPGKKGASKDKEEEDPNKDDSLPQVFRAPEERSYDIFNPKDYVELLKLHIPRPFIFGPIDFTGLDQEDFQADYWKEHVLSTLMRSPFLAAGEDNILIHGFRVDVRGRTLRRPTSLLKHARYLRNLQVTPMLPPELTPVLDLTSPPVGMESDDE